MICKPCQDRYHDGCRGGTWCCCQHKTPKTTATKYGAYVEIDPEDLANLLAELPELNGDDHE